jgi:hypothetical protein
VYLIDELRRQEGRIGRRVDHYHKIRYDHHIYDEELTRAIDEELFGAGPGYARSAYHTISQKFGVDVKYREMWKLGYYTAEKRGFYNYHRDNFKMTDYRNVSIIIVSPLLRHHLGRCMHSQLAQPCAPHGGDSVACTFG